MIGRFEAYDGGQDYSYARAQERERAQAKKLAKHMQAHNMSAPSDMAIADAFLTLEIAGKKPSAALRALGSLDTTGRTAIRV